MKISSWALAGILSVPLAATLVTAARADTVTFASGKVIEDVETKEEGDKIRITKADGSSMMYPKSMISKIDKKATAAQESGVKAKSLADEFQRKRKALPPDDAQVRIAFATWCDERDMAEDARSLYQEALSIDPKCADAHLALGHIKYNDDWFPTVQEAIDGEQITLAKDLAGLRELVTFCEANHATVPPGLLQHILSLAPDDEDAHRRLGHLEIEGRWEIDPQKIAEAQNKKAEEQSKEVVLKLLEAWKVGDQPAGLWKNGEALVSLFAVRNYVLLKTLPADQARRAWVGLRLVEAYEEETRTSKAHMEASMERVHAEELVRLKPDGRYDQMLEKARKSAEECTANLEKIRAQVKELERAHEGEEAMLVKHAPGIYWGHRLRIQSSNKGGSQIEAMWDVVLERVGQDWKVVCVLDAQ